MLLSIITINLNNKNGLEQTLRSIISQSFKDYEIIIIDGASTDGSLDVINNYSQYITYCVSENDSGVYNAMNKGLVKANGEYLYFLNSGDVLYDDGVLNKVVSEFGDVDIVYGDVELVPSNRKSFIKTYPNTLTMNFFYNSSLCHQSIFFRKILFDRYGLYSEEYKYSSDWLFTMNCLVFENCSYLHVNDIIVRYDLTGISFTCGDELKKERDVILNKMIPQCILADYMRWNSCKRSYIERLRNKLKSIYR